MPPVRAFWLIPKSTKIDSTKGGWRRAVLLMPSPKEGWAEQRHCLFCLIHQLLKGNDLCRQPAMPDNQTASMESSCGG